MSLFWKWRGATRISTACANAVPSTCGPHDTRRKCVQFACLPRAKHKICLKKRDENDARYRDEPHRKCHIKLDNTIAATASIDFECWPTILWKLEWFRRVLGGSTVSHPRYPRSVGFSCVLSSTAHALCSCIRSQALVRSSR